MNRPEPRWDRDYAYGLQGEFAVDDLLAGLASGQLTREDKRKRRIDARLYLEVEQNPMACGRWRPSGLATTAADVWTFTVDDTGTVFVIRTDVLRRAVEKAKQLGMRLVPCPYGDNPTRGYLLPVDEIVRWGSP